jgi:pyridoxamine 5'-phosphate oxidase
MAARLETLEAIEAAVWGELESATRVKSHPWRLAVLATVEARGDAPAADARVVVLRDLHRASRTLIVYTDPRSPKARQIVAHPSGTIVMWSQAMGWQLRMRVAVTLHGSGLDVSSRWARLKMTPAAHDYLSPLPPGSAVERPNPERSSREFFAVLAAEVLALDWTELHPDGNRRAQFDAEGGRWVAV